MTVLLGAHVDPDGRGATTDQVEAFETSIGRPLAIDHRFLGWGESFATVLGPWDRNAGRTPLLTWEPFGAELAGIAEGRYDTLIAARAREVKSFAAPVLLRFAHEMNGDWYPWSGLVGGGAGLSGPETYVAAWRHVHEVFREVGARNVRWVWAPNHASTPAAEWNHWRHYYPGGGYVDWVGVDGYNWGTSRSWSSWTSFADIVGPVYRDYADSKPIMVAETSSTHVGGDKAAWIEDVRAAVTGMPGIRALVWFQVRKEEDWSVDSSPASLGAFRALAGDPYFGRGARPSSA